MLALEKFAFFIKERRRREGRGEKRREERRQDRKGRKEERKKEGGRGREGGKKLTNNLDLLLLTSEVPTSPNPFQIKRP